MIQPDVRLLRMTEGLLKAMQFEETFERETGAQSTSEQLAVLRQQVRMSLEFHERIQAVCPWTGYLVISTQTSTLVGLCGFKGNPSEGTVEIAYGTISEFEGRGFATATATAMVEIARNSGEVSTVIAHTLPEKNASGRLLEKNGFTMTGAAEDPEDGPVWRWELKLE
ncbi:MAG: GNAT family N-acetyltransferase [Planctomycetes bacterium]|nr:GNAT family N-acetyltransferase [Planctomycetota bacterium]